MRGAGVGASDGVNDCVSAGAGAGASDRVGVGDCACVALML